LNKTKRNKSLNFIPYLPLGYDNYYPKN